MTKMLYGETRTQVEQNHALIAPDSHVVSPIHGWQSAEGVVLISPAMRGPLFAQYLVHGGDACRTRGAASDVERLVYVLVGEVTLDGARMGADSFAWFPPGDACDLVVPAGTGFSYLRSNTRACPVWQFQSDRGRSA